MTDTLRVGQFSAYFGDRAGTVRELLDSGVEVLVGDYLAELTMLVLSKTRSRGGLAYAGTFVAELAGHLPEIAERGVKVVTNAGGLDPLACADAVRKEASERGVELTVAAVTGDDVLGALDRLRAEGETFAHLDDGRPAEFSSDSVLTANAYLGAGAITEALSRGADIVITGRVTDASLVMGPAAWRFGWSPADLDELAGALWAGHAIECGAQVTGGNFSLFAEHGDLGRPGMPIAEIAADGSCVVTKAAGSGGVVTVDTVKAQLFYEVGGPLYHNPDVVADLSAITVEQAGKDRVRISGARGLPPTGSTKLSLSLEGGYRNTMIVGVTGGRVAEKLAWLRREVEASVGGPADFDAFRWSVVGPQDSNGGTFDQATALVFITVRDRDRARVGRSRFADPIVQLGVSNIPGYYMATPPQKERLVGVQWPCLIPMAGLEVRIDGLAEGVVRVPVPSGAPLAAREAEASARPEPDTTGEPVELGTVFGTRSGDKAGTANLGVWGSTDEQYAWLAAYLTVDRLRALLPELAGLPVHRHELPNLHGLNFTVPGYLEDGVASCTRIDAQAKGVGEYLGSRLVPVPTALRRHVSGGIG